MVVANGALQESTGGSSPLQQKPALAATHCSPSYSQHRGQVCGHHAPAHLLHGMVVMKVVLVVRQGEVGGSRDAAQAHQRAVIGAGSLFLLHQEQRGGAQHA